MAVDVKTGGLSNPPGNTQFGEVWKKIQSDYGAKAEKPRQAKKTLDKDDFLKIMVTQMKHQDPTKPFEAEKLAAEIAQIASVEQLQNVNLALKKLATQNTPLEKMAMTNLIGKEVTMDRNRFTHSEGLTTQLSYNLPEDASEVTVGIFNDKGELIHSKELGQQTAGTLSYGWDGMKNNTIAAPSGSYMFKVEAVSSQGKKLNISNQNKARVIGVSYEGADPVLLVGDHKSHQRVSMAHVIRIEDGGQGGAGNSTAPVGGTPKAFEPVQGPEIPKLKNFIPFGKEEAQYGLPQDNGKRELAAQGLPGAAVTTGGGGNSESR